MTDKEIVERAKEAEKRTGFGELVHSPISKGVNSAFGIGFIEGMVEYRNFLQEEPVSEEWIEELRTKLNSMSKEDFKKVFDKYAVDFNEEPVSEDLGEYVNELSKQFPEVSFAKLSRIAVRVSRWQKENLWKSAEGSDLPIIDREVIALLDNGKVVFAHRPNPEGWDAKSIITEKVERYIPETYDKGGWNIPDVRFWLDVKLPKEIEL